MNARSRAFAVVDLGFGDAGKGLVTDYLVRRHDARLVVRFNGGGQAGHNVVTDDGRHHTFSQFGAGTFVSGVRTHLARSVVVHPTALRVEAERLAALGEGDALRRLSVDPRCRVTTPFQQAAGRLRERLRGDARHGSCGVGFGETVSDALEYPALTLTFQELRSPEQLRDRLEALRQVKLREWANAELDQDPIARRELGALSDASLAERWLEAAAQVARSVEITADEALTPPDAPVVFEGAQGVLLDERFGFHPFTTWSSTTASQVPQLFPQICGAGRLERIGVIRAHGVRHGPGPLPTEDAEVSANSEEPHNGDGPWQGRVRKGWPDLVLLDYALRACPVDTLALTHLDALERFSSYRVCESYEAIGSLLLPSSLAAQTELTGVVLRARPRYTALRPGDFTGLLRERLAVPVKYAVSGVTAGAVHEPRRG